MEKNEVVACGDKLVGILEALRAAGLAGATEYEKMHRACKDYYEHPAWDRYEKIVGFCHKIMTGEEVNWGDLYADR